MNLKVQIGILFLILLLFCNTGNSQNLNQLNEQALNDNLKAMKVSGIWSGLSMTTGATGYLLSESKWSQGFHGTNFAFGALNGLVVLKGMKDLRQSKIENNNFQETIDLHRKIERLYVFNNAFNYAFIFGGLFLKEKANSFNSRSKKDVFKGIGDGLMLQGIFFLIFDTTMYFKQKFFNDKKLGKLLPVEISFNGNQIGLKWNIQ